MFGEILGWSLKELVVILYVFISITFPAVVFDDERRLGDHLQGDGSYSREEAWSLTAAYAITTCIMTVLVTLIFYGPVLNIIKGIFWRNVICLYRIKVFFRGKKDDSKNNTESGRNEEIEEESQEAVDSNSPFDREVSDDLAFEFAIECLRTPYAFAANGTFSGIITSAFTDHYGLKEEVVISSYGILEVYAILIAAVGALRISRSDTKRDEGEKQHPLISFLIEWFATWSGFAIASLGTSPGGISALVENMETFPNWSIELIRACVSALFALILLFFASKIRVTRRILFKIQVSDDFAIRYGNILSMAAVYGFAIAWEDFFGDLACLFADVMGSGNRLSPTAVMWIYFLIVAVIMFPISILMKEYGENKMREAENELSVYHERNGMKSEDHEN